MTDKLIYITQQAGMQLLTPPGTLTWKARDTFSTIDLAFMTHSLAECMIKCGIDQQLEHGSDHFLITTEFAICSISQVVQKKHSWKKINKEEIAAEVQYLQQSDNLDITTDIKIYIEYLFQFIKKLVSYTVLLNQSAKEFACF